MPRGGKRNGAGRPSGTGRFGSRTKLVRIPDDLIPEVNAILEARQKGTADKRAKRDVPALDRVPIPSPGRIELLPSISALDALQAMAQFNVRPTVTILDPWYRLKTSQGRSAFVSEVLPLINAAAEVSSHVFVWGFPEALGRLIDLWSSRVKLEAWLTWSYTNAQNRSRSWRPAQQACLHLRHPRSRMYPEHFMNARQRAHAESNRLEFKMTPRTVFEEPLLSGFIRRSEQQGYPAQKPVAVISRLLTMTTRPGDLVADVTAGSGTTGVAAIQAGCSAILADRSPTAIKVMRRRLGGLIVGSTAALPHPLR
ncbi:site-specific DNA-methyltransferase [Solimonas sp. K1W22B-7]|uniref:DNA methyltransferase n=1 Tax=Solimonas sp. K1W22B-7 TaxID=2303331 RepID=UPI000E331B87|nr:DNA methyltransferase [Solimonas sp. K1W22B-7]AXQ31094.1 site-specific DNA-methyltransferase [Solimonas sp. K1W22B-7]